MTVLHLETGHVVAAATCGPRDLTVDDLTGGDYVAVRLPDSVKRVNVAANLLTAAAYERDDDVLSNPLAYRVDANLPVLVFGGTPTNLTGGHITAPAGTATLSLWQVGNQLEVGRSVLDNSGQPEGTSPTGTTAQIVVCAGEPLAYKTS
jgi:hypothetical protein